MNLTVHKKFHQDSSKDNTQENQGGSEEKRDNRSSNVACAPVSKEQNVLIKVSDTLNNYGKMKISSTSAIPATRSDIVRSEIRAVFLISHFLFLVGRKKTPVRGRLSKYGKVFFFLAVINDILTFELPGSSFFS